MTDSNGNRPPSDAATTEEAVQWWQEGQRHDLVETLSTVHGEVLAAIVLLVRQVENMEEPDLKVLRGLGNAAMHLELLTEQARNGWLADASISEEEMQRMHAMYRAHHQGEATS